MTLSYFHFGCLILSMFLFGVIVGLNLCQIWLNKWWMKVLVAQHELSMRDLLRITNLKYGGPSPFHGQGDAKNEV